MTFRISDKVVCVDDSPSRPCPNGFRPNGLEGTNVPIRKGVVYVVSDVSIINNTPGCRVTGIIRFSKCGNALWFTQSRFRKLTDIQAENAAKREELIPCGKEARRE